MEFNIESDEEEEVFHVSYTADGANQSTIKYLINVSEINLGGFYLVHADPNQKSKTAIFELLWKDCSGGVNLDEIKRELRCSHGTGMGADNDNDTDQATEAGSRVVRFLSQGDFLFFKEKHNAFVPKESAFGELGGSFVMCKSVVLSRRQTQLFKMEDSKLDDMNALAFKVLVYRKDFFSKWTLKPH